MFTIGISLSLFIVELTDFRIKKEKVELLGLSLLIERGTASN